MGTRKRGFTLIELLVVMSIIAALMGLLLPAVQSARETSRKSSCLSNIHEFGLATQLYDQSRQHYPGYFNYVAGTATSNPVGRTVTYIVMLMPYLERNDLYRIWNDPNVSSSSTQLTSAQVYLPIAICPSNPPASNTTQPISYVGNSGIGDSSGLPTTQPNLANLQAAAGIFQDRTQATTPNVTSDYVSANDGLSMTLMFSENLLPSMTWFNATTALTGSPSGTAGTAQIFDTFVWYHTPPTAPTGCSTSPANSINSYRALAPSGTPSDLQWSRPSSNHPGGANAVFCDGHAKFLGEEIQPGVYKQLMSPNGTVVNQLMPDADQTIPLNENTF